MKKIAIIGAGPAGLTAAYELVKSGESHEIVIFEADKKYVGGISRTVDYKGYKFDIGGHRFFTKNEEINKIWQEILPTEFVERNRKSSIFYKNKYYKYPLEFFNALTNLGLINASRAVFSYVKAKLKPVKYEKNYEDWMTNRFGRFLFNTFFKTYTEKIWGIKTSEISKDWAIQRVKTFTLGGAIHSIFSKKSKSKFKTLIDKFYYPTLGPGMMWESFAEKLKTQNVKIIFNTKVNKIIKQKNKWILKENSKALGEFDYVISTMPLSELVSSIDEINNEIRNKVEGLKYRDFITVLLIINKQNLFDDNWIYIHDPEVKVGRIQNFKNWSEEMVPDKDKTSLGMEYFIFENDDLWDQSDEYFFNLAKEEIEKIGICKIDLVEDGYIYRMKKAYPVYDLNYQKTVEQIRQELSKYKNLFTIGRNGMHKWNNQDHSMLTGIAVAMKILNPNYKINEWEINTEQRYLEQYKGKV